MNTATVSALDRGLLFGDGVFDTMLVMDGIAVAGAAHRERFCRHAAAIGIALDPIAVAAAQSTLFAEAGSGPLIVRTTVTRGVGVRGLWPATVPSPTISVTATPLDPRLIGNPAKLVTSSIPRNHQSPTARIKSLNYLDNILAARDASAKGADDALFLNTAGNIACSTIANVFAVYRDRLVTPPLCDGAMDGIVRGNLLADPPAGFTVAEETLDTDAILQADAVFLTNSVRLLRPVRQLDNRTWLPHEAEARILAHLRARLFGGPGSRTNEGGLDPK